MSPYIKKIIFLTFLLLIVYRVFAPSSNTLVIIEAPPPIQPFKQLIYAIGKVETNFDTLAYNPVEKAAGYFQIRPIRINDYNKRTRSHYSTKDMFDYKTSEKVFLYYASQIGPYRFEKIAKNWNGSGRKTIQYWKKVQKHL